MDTPLWCWIALALLAAALTSLSGMLSRLALRLGESVLKRIAPKIDSHVAEVFAGPLRLLLWVTVFRATIPITGR